ncbi:MAG: helix-turn-helix domain-containing GNAT family N-acetyltransferase [Actinomycetota bacterium]
MSVVSSVRSFARTFTERVGALDDAFLGQQRPLGQARLLWEIGAAERPVEVGSIRRRLGLDSGYLSRLLRALESDGLLDVSAGEKDRRARVARLTAAGRAEWRELDRRSDERAELVLGRLDDRRRDELTELLRRAEQLILAGAARFEEVDPRDPDAVASVTAYFTELDERFVGGFHDWDAVAADAPGFDPPDGLFVLVRCGDDVAGCGGVQTIEAGVGEIKRMWIHPAWRGVGLAPRLLTHLESVVAHLRHHTVRLDTNAVLNEAIRMYERAGYSSIDRYNDNPYAERWFEKRIS